MIYEGMTEKMLPVLQQASKAILDIYVDEDRFHTELKGDDSPLTAADKASNQIICEALGDLFPGIPVISEETKQADFEERRQYDRYFLVDPLDGTKEFIKRNGEFTINIAYAEGQRTMAGFVYIPCESLTYAGVQGYGAQKIYTSGQSEKLTTRPFYLHDPGLQVVASRSHLDAGTASIISKLNVPELVSKGSSLKFILIAEGKADFYPRLAPTMEWDTAAAQCILEEAGGQILKYPELHPLVYNKADLTNPWFIATGALLDPESLRALVQNA